MEILEGPSTALVTPPTIRESNIYAKSKTCSIPKWNNWLTGNYVPCRRCENCLHRKRSYWVHRMVREQHYWARVWFITLTYRNVHDHDYKNVQTYLKRCRRKTPDIIKYVCTTEFESKGSRSYNPHHHLLVYSTASSRYRHFSGKWDHGYATVKDVSSGLAKETRLPSGVYDKPAKYIAKGS